MNTTYLMFQVQSVPVLSAAWPYSPRTAFVLWIYNFSLDIHVQVTQTDNGCESTLETGMFCTNHILHVYDTCS